MKQEKQISRSNVQPRESIIRRRTTSRLKPKVSDKTDQESFMLMKFLMKTFDHIDKAQVLRLVDAMKK